MPVKFGPTTFAAARLEWRNVQIRHARLQPSTP